MTSDVILFDLDDTLVIEKISTETALFQTCSYAHQYCGINVHVLYQAICFYANWFWHKASTFLYCEAIGISPLEGLWAQFEGEDPQLQTLRCWAPTYRQQIWSSALLEQGVTDPALVEALVMHFQEERRSRHVAFPEVRHMLSVLHTHNRLGLITNGAPDLQREKIEKTALEQYFDVILISGEVGVGKPEPQIFQLALQALDVESIDTVMVGDNFARDIIGAQRAGIRGIWLQRMGSHIIRHHPNQEHIHSLYELYHLLC